MEENFFKCCFSKNTSSKTVFQKWKKTNQKIDAFCLQFLNTLAGELCALAVRVNFWPLFEDNFVL
jgi:hypothetical protein